MAHVRRDNFYNCYKIKNNKIKSANLLLQEYAAKRNIPLPTFYFEDENKNFGTKYNCFCYFDGKSALGTHLSKKLAKQDTEENLVQILKLRVQRSNGDLNHPPYLLPIPKKINVTRSSDNIIDKDYVSELNDFCTKNKQPLPRYSDAGKEDGLFLIHAMWKSYQVQGKGTLKKLAKQNCAREILKLLELFVFKDENCPRNETVITLYYKNKMSFGGFPTTLFNKKLKSKESSQKPMNHDEKIEKLKNYNINYKLTKYLSNPYVYTAVVEMPSGPVKFLIINDDQDTAIDKILSIILKFMNIK